MRLAGTLDCGVTNPDTQSVPDLVLSARAEGTVEPGIGSRGSSCTNDLSECACGFSQSPWVWAASNQRLVSCGPCLLAEDVLGSGLACSALAWEDPQRQLPTGVSSKSADQKALQPPECPWKPGAEQPPSPVLCFVPALPLLLS
ncbi:hypothetical protein P7K49_023663 [Saguinus oedipus]|uniref:Uncharacterized protein n=1 Tax=Saguinus oedipus TaxID=9490 RepID=A0ABQ9UPL3_SAGOE|nr:hypothetical protein P7K49_023663 [Saguinus oedipus]